MNLPRGWDFLTMDEIGEVQAGRQRSPHLNKGNMLPYLRVANVQNGWIDFADVKEMPFTDKEVATYQLEPGDILLSEGQSLELVGRPAMYNGEMDLCCFQNTLVRLRTKRHSSDFVLQLCKYLFDQGAFQRIAKKTTSIAHLGVSRFAGLSAPVPPLSEQRKIADILTTWDVALDKLDALARARERHKKALTQQLLTGKRRLNGFLGAWKKVQLSDLAENIADQNKGRMGTKSLYAVTKAEGMIPMRDHVKGESFERCKRVETDWFAYNPMRINIGSIARWKGKQPVMVSGDYIVFRCLPNLLEPAYLDHLRRSWMWQSFVTRGGNGSVRVRIYFDDLAEFTFRCPPIEEQRQIATILDIADQELALLRAQRAAVEQQKRGLMQRLLTGRLRVKT